MEAVFLATAEAIPTPETTTEEKSWLWLCQHPEFDAEQLQGISITLDDFIAALKCVQPSAQREGFATVPDVTWENVGALSHVRQELHLAILVGLSRFTKFLKKILMFFMNTRRQFATRNTTKP